MKLCGSRRQKKNCYRCAIVCVTITLSSMVKANKSSSAGKINLIKTDVMTRFMRAATYETTPARKRVIKEIYVTPVHGRQSNYLVKTSFLDCIILPQAAAI